jgi:predicted MFS family arabinose efflux permease
VSATPDREELSGLVRVSSAAARVVRKGCCRRYHLGRRPIDPRLICLAFGNFAMATGMLVVPGMLNELAAGLDRPVAVAGQLTTAFALAVAFGAPLLAVATSGFDRRKLLVLALAALGVLQFGAAVAPGFVALLVVRFLTGLAPALYTPQAAATAALLVPPEKRGGAIAFVFLGFSIANVAGVPLGAWLGGNLGWRLAMAAVGGIAIAAAAWAWLAVPRSLPIAPLDRRAWGELARDRALVAVIALTAIQSTAQFTLFNYIAPALRDSLGATPAMIGGALAWFGLWGIAGNLAGVRAIDSVGAPRVVMAALLTMVCGIALWRPAMGSLPFTALALALWGLGCFAVNSAQQVRLVGLNPGLATAAVAFNSSAIYLGQALGAVVGGAILVKAGLVALPLASVPLFVLAIAITLFAQRLANRSRGERAPA